MISEPEMVDEFGAVGAGEVVGDFGQRPAVGPRPRRPWRWAVGGAVLASALWAGALYVYPVGAPEPDLHGYRMDGDPCPTVRLKAIGAAIAPTENTPRIEPEHLNDPALDRAKCFISLRSPAAKKPIRSRWYTEYSVGVTVTLHKRTDPAAEFEAMRGTTDSGTDADAKVEKVPNLGDSAYLLTQDDGNAELRVREGGAVLSLSLASYAQFDSEDGEAPPDEGPDTSDLSPYQSAMISDMRDLMKSLKH
ncbi:hypothetical protein GCM10015535_52360 [Streptomyces gelaticus]|uniref:Uncharacterized protein n=1 Tax=Streptomyces gelaticus TaxID=285446 RepID=A0ABQ2W4G6_9ACTN|nr:hypothetical protein [Streptomyces gelaticus]GGV92097.1 hypothetical protein GCM10015535_52360 [Streptomyces gelaticus]